MQVISYFYGIYLFQRATPVELYHLSLNYFLNLSLRSPMKNMIRSIVFVAISNLLVVSSTQAASLMLDFQPTGGTTASGFTAYEVINGDIFPAAGEDFIEFGTTITVTLSASNLDSSPTDYRSVTRNGGASDVVNDWIGVDARGNNPSAAEFTITVSGLPSGIYTWLSQHHDGGAGASSGNISGSMTTSFTDASGTTMGASGISSQNAGDPISTFSRSFTSDGSDVVLTLSSTGSGPDAIFAFANSLVIADVVPEPSTGVLALLGILLITFRRRR
jgi:hypothetical protein